jgi:hypothetical protein
LQVDDQFDLDCLLDWHLRGFFPLKASQNASSTQTLVLRRPTVIEAL